MRKRGLSLGSGPTPDIDQLFSEAERAKRLGDASFEETSSGGGGGEQSARQATLLVEASTDLEGKALVHKVVVMAMKKAGQPLPTDHAGMTFADITRDLDRAAQFHIHAPYLLGKKRPHPRVCYTHDDEWLDIVGAAKPQLMKKWSEKTLPDGVAGAVTTGTTREPPPELCILHSFEPGQQFQSLVDGKTYVASGDVFVCESSARVHHCTAGACNAKHALPRSEGFVCDITGRFYQPGFVQDNNTTTRRFRDSKDGALATQGGLGVSLDTWKPVRTTEQRRGFRQKGKEIKSRSENAMNALRAQSEGSSLYYVNLEDVETLEGEEGELARQAFAHTRSHTPQSTILLVEFEMRKRFPGVNPPTLTTEMRAQVNEQCRNMLYVATSFVRSDCYRQMNDGVVKARTSLSHYFRKRNLENRKPDPCYVALKIMEETMPHMERLESLGLLDSSVPDKAMLLYLEEAVIATWLLLQYTPHARRYHSGIHLLSNVVGILYKLQSGVYVEVNGERVVLIPRHDFLDKLPQKCDLNRYHQAYGTGVSSETSIATEKLVDDCFSKLPKDEETLAAFCLERYIKLWNGA